MPAQKAQARGSSRGRQDGAGDGWAGTKNGSLLRLVEREFDVFLTSDQNLEHQQNLKAFDLAVIVLVAFTNDIEDLKPLMPTANEALSVVGPGK